MFDLDFFDMNFEIKPEVVCIGANKEGAAYNQSVLLSKLGYETLLLSLEDEIPEVKIVSITEVFDEKFCDTQAIKSLLEKARKAAQIVCVDLKLKEETKVSFEEIRELLPMIDFLLLDKEEAIFLTKEAFPMAMGQVLYESGVKTIIMKDGKNGCFLYSKDLRFAMGAFPCEVVETSGVGDNFAAGFLYGLLDEVNLRDSCEYGSACAAISLGFSDALCEAEKRKEAINRMIGR